MAEGVKVMSDKPEQYGWHFVNPNPAPTRWQRIKAWAKGEPPPGTIFPTASTEEPPAQPTPKDSDEH